MRVGSWFAKSVVTLAVLCLAPLRAGTQESANHANIDWYIHEGWDRLGRSMSDCASVVDPKLTTAPIVYLPAGMAVPASVRTMQQNCRVEVEPLPRRIQRIGDLRPVEVAHEGLLFLPNRYVVPGGRFNEMYGWDSYFILLGLVQDGRVPLAQGMVENFFFEIEHYGGILNANRTYFLTRSQPPLLSSMIAEIFDQTHDRVWLARAYEFAQRDYGLWTRAPHLAGTTGLARYSDVGVGPVPEMEDDSTYYPDVIRWLLAHPEVPTGYLIDGPEHPDAAQAAELARTSCEVRVTVCLRAYADGHRLSAAFFHGDRAMRESGFDTTFRFGPFSGSTDEFAPVCLNSLLYKYERDMAGFAKELGWQSEAARWNQRAQRRGAAIDRLLWHEDRGMFLDYDFVHHRASSYPYAAVFYPLWAGLATPMQAAAIAGHLGLFERPGGVAMSNHESGTQWDLPYGWAPIQWFAIEGLRRYGFTAEASRVAAEFRQTVETNFERDGTIREKYDVVSGSANVSVATGYKANVVGFGWTNGVYARLRAGNSR